MADYSQQADALDEQLKVLDSVVRELDKVSETAPAAEFGAITALTDVLAYVVNELDGVSAKLRDGGLDVTATQQQMASRRGLAESLTSALNSK